MKRLGTICALAFLAFALLLASCRGKNQAAAAAADPNAPVTVTVWGWDPTTVLYQARIAADIYMKDHPNVTVDVVETPWNDVQQKLITGFTSGQTDGLPDTTYMQDNSMQKTLINYADFLLPVNGKVDLSKFAPFKLGLAKWEGQDYAVPGDIGTTAFFIRRDIIEKAGLTLADFDMITWEKVMELARVVKSRTGVALFSTDQTGPDFFALMLQGCGQWFFDQNDGKPILNSSPAMKRVMEVMLQMYRDGTLILAEDWNGYIATLNNGTAAATVQGCWIMGSIQANPEQKGLWGMVATPRFEDPALNSVNYSSQGGSGYIVLKNSKNPDVTMDFLDKTFAGSMDVYAKLVERGLLGSWLPAVDTPEYQASSEFFGGEKVYAKIMEYSGVVPMIKMGVYNYEARDALVKAFMNVVNGQTLQAALDEAQRSVEFLVEQ
jgi:lactose/L-arabinose transport system substrate-binding protein